MKEDEVSISKHLLIPLSLWMYMYSTIHPCPTSGIFEAAVNASLTASGVSLDDLGIIITHAGNLSAKYPIRGKKTDVSSVMSQTRCVCREFVGLIRHCLILSSLVVVCKRYQRIHLQFSCVLVAHAAHVDALAILMGVEELFQSRGRLPLD